MSDARSIVSTLFLHSASYSWLLSRFFLVQPFPKIHSRFDHGLNRLRHHQLLARCQGDQRIRRRLNELNQLAVHHELF